MADDPLTPASTLRPSTIAVTAGRPAHEPDAPLNVPITMASTYVAGGDLEYGRYANPTWTALEDTLGALEGGRCLTFASGMAAVTTVLDLVGNGAKVVAPRHSYSGTIVALADLEARGRVKAELVDITDTEAVVKACDDAALVWLESPTNPALEIADVEAITAAAHDAGAYVAVDNTFATPLLQTTARPGRRPRRALRDEVPRRPQRCPPRRDLHARRRALRRAQESSRPDGRDPRRVRGVARPARHADPARPRGASTGQRAGAGTPPARPPGDLRGALPRLRRHRLDRARAGCDGRRPPHPQDEVVGARDVPRRRRVDPRATSPLEGRGTPRSPKASSGSPSASRTSRTSGTTSAPRSTAASASADSAARLSRLGGAFAPTRRHVCADRSAPDDVWTDERRERSEPAEEGRRRLQGRRARASGASATSPSQTSCRGR